MSEPNGCVRIAPEVLATIVNLTAMSIPGVVAMSPVPRGRLLRTSTPALPGRGAPGTLPGA